MAVTAHGVGERTGLVGFAMNEENLFAPSDLSAGVIKEFGGIGVGAEAVQDGHFTAQREGFAEDADGGLALNEATAEGVLGLKTDNEDGVFGVEDAVAKVVQNAPAFTHAAGGDDHAGGFAAHEAFGIVAIADEMNPRTVEQVAHGGGELSCLGVVALRMVFKDFSRIDGQWAVHIYGNAREVAGGEKAAQGIYDGLRTADAESGDDDPAVAVYGAADYLGES